MGLMNRIKQGWNAFLGRDPTDYYRDVGVSYSYRPDRPRPTKGNERSMVTAIITRMAMDAAAVAIKHVNLDEQGRYLSTRDSGLNDCLTLEANIDQTGRAFMQDVYFSMFDEGVVAMVPIDTSISPDVSSSYDILTMRTGKILEWRPQTVKVRVYNERTGHKEDIIVPKRTIAIVENPLYPIMNEPNSTMQRLVRKLNLLDAIDEQSSSGKLDLIIQLPYVIRTDIKRQQAEDRRKEIEKQLANSKYGIAYTDGTERITQLNRPVENNLMKTIEFLTSMLYGQLGINQEVMDGTANEETMTNYFNRSIEPAVSAPVDEMKRKFLTKTARSQGQSIMYFNDPFKLVSATKLATISDSLTRNAILSSNEVRQKFGYAPSNDPKADELSNKNISAPSGDSKEPSTKEVVEEES